MWQFYFRCTKVLYAKRKVGKRFGSLLLKGKSVKEELGLLGLGVLITDTWELVVG